MQATPCANTEGKRGRGSRSEMLRSKEKKREQDRQGSPRSWPTRRPPLWPGWSMNGTRHRRRSSVPIGRGWYHSGTTSTNRSLVSLLSLASLRIKIPFGHLLFRLLFLRCSFPLLRAAASFHLRGGWSSLLSRMKPSLVEHGTWKVEYVLMRVEVLAMGAEGKGRRRVAERLRKGWRKVGKKSLIARVGSCKVLCGSIWILEDFL